MLINIPKILLGVEGIGTPQMLEPILPLIPLDQYGKNYFVLMLKCEGGNADTSLWEGYKVILKKGCVL